MDGGEDSKKIEDIELGISYNDNREQTPTLVNKMVKKGLEVETRDCEEDNQTGREIQELIASWGIVKWGEYRTGEGASFAQFWEESFVKNVRIAVQ